MKFIFKNTKYRFIVEILLATVLFLPSITWANPLEFQIVDKMNKLPVNQVMGYFEDKTSKLTIKQIIQKSDNSFQPRKKSNFGYTDAIYWARLRVNNTGNTNIDWRLELDYSVFDHVVIYDSNGTKLSEGGDGIVFDKRQIFFRNVVFPLKVPSKATNTFFIKLKTKSSMIIPFFAYTVPEFQQRVANEQMLFGLYYGAMLVMLIYNAFLFFSTRDKSYFYYAIYIAGYILFQSTINGLAFQYLWPNSIWWANLSLPFLMCYAVAGAALFSREFLNVKKRTPFVYKIYYGVLAYCALGMILTFFLDYYIIIRIAIFVCFPVVLLIYVNGFQCYRLGHKSAFYFLIAWTLFLLGVVLYASKAFGLLPSNFFTTWAIQIGSIGEVVLLSFALANKINELTLNLQDGIEDLRSAHLKIQESESKFRNLFEASEDLTFTLDTKLRFTSANKALKKILGFEVKNIVGTNFLDILFKDGPENFNTILVKEKLAEMHRHNLSVQFQASFSQRRVKEPRELWVSLQFMGDNGEKDILGRAALLGEDLLFRDFQSEKLVIYTKNFIGNVDVFSHRLTTNIHKYADTLTVGSIKLCIREVLINAIEHGNLNVTFDEKTEAMDRGEYFEFLQERQKDSRYKGKKILLEYILNENHFGLRITDEGTGFDHKKRMSTSLEQLNIDGVGHGRGIFLLLETFDSVKYNEVGNQVTLVKKFK